MRGEPLRVTTLAWEGMTRAWLTFKVVVRCAWAVVAAGVLVSAFVVRPSGVLDRLSTDAPVLARWLSHAAVAPLYALVMSRLAPALAIALARPEQGAGEAMRAARELARGARGRLFIIGLLIYTVGVPASELHQWVLQLEPVRERAVGRAAYGLVSAAFASLSQLAPPIVHRALAAEKGDRSTADLGQVFE